MPHPVWAVCRRHPEHKVRFPARENAERWMAARDDMWDIVPVEDDPPVTNVSSRDDT